MKIAKYIILGALIGIFIFGYAFAQQIGDYRSAASGNWSTAAIWETYNGTNWVPAGTPPTGSETIAVLSPDSVFVDVLVTITDTLINQGIVEPVDSLTITIANGGVYQHDRDEGTMPKCIWETGSTVYITGVTGTAPADRDQNYYNMVFNTPDLLSNLNMNLNDNTIGGDVRVINTGLARWYLTSVDPLDTATVTIMGDVIVEDGQFSVQGTSNALTTFIVHQYGNINVTGGDFSISRGSQGSGTTTWYLHEGNFSMSNASSHNSTSLAGGARFIFDKPGGTQTLSLSNITQYFSNAIPFEVSSTTTLDVGTDPIEGTGIFVLNEDATLATAHAGGVAGSIQTAGTLTLSDSANFTFNGIVAQVTSTMMPDTVMNLTIDNAAGVALSQPTLINGLLKLVSGVFDNTLPFKLGPNGTISFEGGSLLIGVVSATVSTPPCLPENCQLTTGISVDMTGAQSPNNLLGSFDGSLTWDPTLFQYNSNSGFKNGFTGTINTTNVANGIISFIGNNPSGVGGNVEILDVFLDEIGTTGDMDTLDLDFTSMTASTGQDLSLMVPDSPIKIVASGLLGDVNQDGFANSTDALIVLSYDAGLPIPPAIIERIECGFGDTNGDGSFNSTDGLILLSYDVGIPIPFPVGQNYCP